MPSGTVAGRKVWSEEMRKWRSAAARRICQLAGVKSVELAVVEIGHRLTEGLQLPPTDLHAILPRVDVSSCNSDPELLISGELRKGEDGLEIVYSESQSRQRQRFTIAHEIGHAVFERTGQHCPRRGGELERICDMIASEILAPREAIISNVRLPVQMAEISRLSKLFDVSVTAMAIRCAGIFELTTFQEEFGELDWIVSQRLSGHRLSRRQVIEVLKTLDDSCPAPKLVQVETSNRVLRDYLIESLSTGQNRNLFILTPLREQPPTDLDSNTIAGTSGIPDV